MPTYELSIRDYLRIFRKRKWVIILTVISAIITSFVYASLQIPIYSTSAEIEIIEKSTFGNMLYEAWFQKGDSLGTALRLIKSRRIAEKVIRKLNLIPSDAAPIELERMSQSLQNSISTAQQGATNIVRIGLNGPDPQRITKIVNTVAQIYIAEDVNQQRRESRAVREFLEDQLKEARQRLVKAEAELVAFQKEKLKSDISPETKITVDEISGLRSKYLSLKEQREELEIRLNQLRQLLLSHNIDITSSQEINNNPTIVSLKSKLFEQELSLSDLLKQYTEHHPKVKEARDRLNKLQSQLSVEIERAVGSTVGSLETKIAAMKTRENVIIEQIKRSAQLLETLPEEQLREIHLNQNRKINQELYEMFRKRLEDERIKEAGKLGGVRLVNPASEPKYPISPNKQRIVFTGSIIGFLLGIALAFMVESLDTSIATIEEVEKYTKKPVLGVIPHIRIDDDIEPKKIKINVADTDVTVDYLEERLLEIQKMIEYHSPELAAKPKIHPKMITFYDPKSPISEAYRTLRTNIVYLEKAKHSKVFLLTSSGPQEGKTTTILNLAITMAQLGSKTLIVGTNLRRPQVYKILGLKKQIGFVDIIKGSITWEEALKPTSIENLYAITCGGIPPNPSELLASDETDKLIKSLRKEFDIVLFDAPPLLPVTDAAILSNKVDAALVVYFIGKAAREALLRTIVQLETIKANVIGIVLNDLASQAELGSSSYYYYHYHYRYYGNEERDKLRI